jgi:hypothetical protein
MGDARKRLDTKTPDYLKASSITSSDVSTYLRHGWISRRGWTFAETPFSAIPPDPTGSPESAEARTLLQSAL